MQHRNGSQCVIPPIVEFRYFQKYHSGQNISVPRAKCSMCHRWFSLNHPLDHFKREHGLDFVSTTEVGSLFHSAVAAARKRLPLPTTSSDHQEVAENENDAGDASDQASRASAQDGRCKQLISGLLDQQQPQQQEHLWGSDAKPIDPWMLGRDLQRIGRDSPLLGRGDSQQQQQPQFCCPQFTVDDIEELALAFMSNHTGVTIQQPVNGNNDDVKKTTGVSDYSNNKRKGAKRDRKINGMYSLDYITQSEYYQNDLNGKKRKLSNGGLPVEQQQLELSRTTTTTAESNNNDCCSLSATAIAAVAAVAAAVVDDDQASVAIWPTDESPSTTATSTYSLETNNNNNNEEDNSTYNQEGIAVDSNSPESIHSCTESAMQQHSGSTEHHQPSCHSLLLQSFNSASLSAAADQSVSSSASTATQQQPKCSVAIQDRMAQQFSDHYNNNNPIIDTSHNNSITQPSVRQSTTLTPTTANQPPLPTSIVELIDFATHRLHNQQHPQHRRSDSSRCCLTPAASSAPAAGSAAAGSAAAGSSCSAAAGAPEFLLQSMLMFNRHRPNLSEDLRCLSDCIDACVAREKELQVHLNVTMDILSRLRRIQSSFLDQISGEISQVLALNKTTEAEGNNNHSQSHFSGDKELKQFDCHKTANCAMYSRNSFVHDNNQQKSPPVFYQPFVCQPATLSRSVINTQSTAAAMEAACPSSASSVSDGTLKKDATLRRD